jgi:TolB-like protein/class 3 adenylate cyclase
VTMSLGSLVMKQKQPTRVGRRLAAIVAADVAGYSRLMGLDEVGTARTLREHRKVTDALVAKHGGRLVKTTGDGVLLEFPSVVDAVECAVAVQAVMAQRNEGIPQDRCMLFRIGINLGDILIEGDDILGDGVNVAARLEGIAEPGGICISSSAYEQVRGRVAAEFTNLGEQTLKNIDRPVRVYAIRSVASSAAAAVKSAAEAGKPLPLPDKPSLAVLPFQNMSGDPEQEYFTDGMVEDIITALSRFKSLFVIARNSTFTYKGKAVDIKQVGRELGVRYVLEGSIRKSGGKVRITGQLIEAATGLHLWADRFDGPLDDTFELQDKVTSGVVAAIAPRLELAEIDRSERKPNESLGAVDLYYRAVHSRRRVNRQGYEDALRLARQVISLDPNFAAAYGLIMDCYVQLRDEGWITEDDLAAEGKQYALRAIEVGADDAYALARTAHFFSVVLKDVATADVIVDQAIAVNPNLSEAWRMRGWTSIFLGQHEPAIEQFHHAMRLNPLDPQIYQVENGLAWANFFLRRFKVALSWVTKSMARKKNFVSAISAATVIYAMLGCIADAQMMLARRRETGLPMTISQLRKRLSHFRPEDVELHVEASRIAGMPE